MALEEAVPVTKFGKVMSAFRGKRSKDSSYSWIVCVSSAVCNAVSLGFALSFGVLFPELIQYFDETRERTGEYQICHGSTDDCF